MDDRNFSEAVRLRGKLVYQLTIFVHIGTQYFSLCRHLGITLVDLKYNSVHKYQFASTKRGITCLVSAFL